LKLSQTKEFNCRSTSLFQFYVGNKWRKQSRRTRWIKIKTCKNENFKEESEFTFQLNSATTADSQRRESHRLTPSRIATGNLRREPPRFVEESHRDSSKIATDSRRGESHRFSMRCKPTILRHGRESPTSLHRGNLRNSSGKREAPRVVALKFSFAPKITKPMALEHASHKKCIFLVLIKARLLI